MLLIRLKEGLHGGHAAEVGHHYGSLSGELNGEGRGVGAGARARAGHGWKRTTSNVRGGMAISEERHETWEAAFGTADLHLYRETKIGKGAKDVEGAALQFCVIQRPQEVNQPLHRIIIYRRNNIVGNTHPKKSYEAFTCQKCNGPFALRLYAKADGDVGLKGRVERRGSGGGEGGGGGPAMKGMAEERNQGLQYGLIGFCREVDMFCSVRHHIQRIAACNGPISALQHKHESSQALERGEMGAVINDVGQVAEYVADPPRHLLSLRHTPRPKIQCRLFHLGVLVIRVCVCVRASASASMPISVCL
mmetsp:Transcript_8581/g.14068  ORF Transcript_8581/g.14068 Transcript_8581/m.14068 type:complete len:306 (-) Transcript_8581:318-1235(-)